MFMLSCNIIWIVVILLCASEGSFDLNEIQLLLQDTRWDHATLKLKPIRDYLRAGDERLVRPSPLSETAQRQIELEQIGIAPVVALALRHDRNSINISQAKLLALVAEIVHLLTTNNARNRMKLGESDVIPSLVAMVESATVAEGEAEIADEVLRGGEEAAEALWILAFAGGNNPNSVASNHDKFGVSGAVQALSDHVLAGRSAKGRMWAAAALGNMAASYNQVPSETSKAVRRQILNHDGLLDALVKMLGQGPVRSDMTVELWPSQALKSQRFASSIEAWGAGQALKSVALMPEAHDALNKLDTVTKACKLHLSRDWLEKLKADLILTNMNAGCTKESNLEL